MISKLKYMVTQLKTKNHRRKTNQRKTSVPMISYLSDDEVEYITDNIGALTDE